MNIGVYQLIYAFYQKNSKLLQDFINQQGKNPVELFRVFTTAGFYAMQSSDYFTSQRVAYYLYIRLENQYCMAAFIDIVKSDLFTDQQIQRFVELLEQNCDKNMKLVDFFGIVQRYRLQIEWKSELTQKLQRYGYNATYRQVISKILPNPTMEDASYMLLLFSSPSMINANKESVSQINKEFYVQIEVEANYWLVDEVFSYLKEKNILVVNVVRNMKLQKIFYSPQILLENTIVALNAYNPYQCYCYQCSMASADGFIELLLKNFPMNKFVRMTYCIGLLTLCHSISRQFNQKVYLYLRYLTPEIVAAYNKLSMQAFFINIGRSECCLIASLPDDAQFPCPFYQALDSCACLLESFCVSSGMYARPNRRCCLAPPVQQSQCSVDVDLDQLMQNYQQAPILPLAFLWRSISLMKTLKGLYEDFPREVEFILSVNASRSELQQELDQRKYADPVAKCPEQLSLTILQMQPTPLLKATLALALNRFLVSTGSYRRVEDLAPRVLSGFITSPYFSFCIQMVWRSQLQFAPQAFSCIDRYSALEAVLSGAGDLQFLLDVLARCENTVVAQQLNFYFLRYGVPFAEALCLCVVKKLCTRIAQQNCSFDLQPYSYACVLGAHSYVQCVLCDFIQEASKQISCSFFDAELKSVYVSPLDIPNRLIPLLYRILLNYQLYFKIALSRDIGERQAKLFQSALQLLKTSYSGLDTTQAPPSDAVFLEVRTAFSEWAKKDRREDLFQRFQTEGRKRTEWFYSAVQVLCRFAGQQSYFDELIGVQYDDFCGAVYLRLDLFKLAGQLIGAQLLTEEQLPQLLSQVVKCLFSQHVDEQALGKAALAGFAVYLKKRYVSEAFSSFADLVMTSPAAAALKDDDLSRILNELAGRAYFRIAQIAAQYKEACQHRYRETERILQNKMEFMVSNFQDELILQFIGEAKSPMRLLQTRYTTATLYDQYKKAMEKMMTLFAPPSAARVDWKKLIPADFRALFAQDKAQFAEFYVYYFIVDMDMQQWQCIPQLYDQILELLVYINYPEILQAIAQHCILTLMRLVFTQNPLTAEQLAFRRQKAILLASYLGKTQFRPEILGITGLSYYELDFSVLIAMGMRCKTLSVVTTFYLYFCHVIFALNDFITPRCGYFREIIEMLCAALRCKHGWRCYACRADARMLCERYIDADRWNCYEDIDSLCQQYYKNDNVGACDEHEIEIVQKEIIRIPDILLDESKISILQKADVYQVPLNLTAALVSVNAALVWNFDCVQICQRSGRVQYIWSKYVDYAYEIVLQLLESVGIKQACDYYKKFFVKYSCKIAQVLIRNSCLMIFAQEILDEILDRFQFEDWVPERLQLIYQEKILHQLSLMAAEQVLSHIYKQVYSLILLRNSNQNKNSKQDFSLQDNNDFDGFATPFDEKSNFTVDDGNDDDLQDKIDIFTDIFATKALNSKYPQAYDKIQWEEIYTHDNYAVFPFTYVNYAYQLLCNGYFSQSNQMSSSATDFCSQAQSIIAKGFCVPSDLPVYQYLQHYLSNAKFESTLERYMLAKYAVNYCAIINNVSNYVPVNKSMQYEEAIKAFARLSKSILSMQNQLASGSHYSSLISMYNLSQNHPLNVQLHSLRIVFNQLWRINQQQAKQYISLFFQYALSAVSIPQQLLEEFSQSGIKCNISSRKQNLTTLYELVYYADCNVHATFYAKLEAYYNQAKTSFLLIFPQDSKIHEYLKDGRHIVKNLCLVPRSCHDQVSLIQSLPFALFAVVSAVYQDNSYTPLDARNTVVAAFQHVIDLAVQMEVCDQAGSKNFSVYDCIYAFISGICRFNILRPEEVDRIFADQLSSSVDRFCKASQQFGVPVQTIKNKCVLTLSAAAEALLEICYNLSDNLVNLQKQVPLSCFPATLQLLEELYVASIETVAIIARSSYSSSGQNESLFATAINLPQCIESLLFLQQTANQGVLQQKKPTAINDLASIGFDISLSDFYMGVSIYARIAELQDTARKYFKQQEAQHQKRAYNGGSMLDNYVQEIMKNFYAAIEDNVCFSQLYYPLVSNVIKNIYVLGYMTNDYFSQCIIDSFLFSTFYSIFQDCKKDISFVAKKLRQIDTLCLLLYYLVYSVPELELNGCEKMSHLAMILFRIQQFYAVFSSLSVQYTDKMKFLQSMRNYDLQNISFNYIKLTQQMVQQLSYELPQDSASGGKDYLYFSYLTNIFVHRLLFSFIRNFLNQQTHYNRNHRVQFSYVISQALYAFRPYYYPQFVSHYVSLITESTILSALLYYRADFSFKNKQVNFIKHQAFYTYPTFEYYFVLLQAFCLYCHGYYSVQNQYGIKQYIRMLTRLLIIISHDFPEFISQYRLRISESLHLYANYIRIFLFASDQQYQLTDDISGMLALPYTDYTELIEMEELSEELRKVLHQEQYLNYMHDVINAFKQYVMKTQSYEQVAPFLHYIVINLIYMQLDRKKIEETTGFKIINDLLRDLITQDFGKFIVIQMLVFVANPSVETYCFSAILQCLMQQKSPNSVISQYIYQQIKYRANGSYGCQILCRKLQQGSK